MTGFEDWARARSASLARSAYLLTADHHHAEDLLQETLIRVAQHWPRLSATGEPDAWARTTMHRLSIDRWRRRRARPQEVAPDHHDRPGPDHAQSADDRLTLAAALARLTPRQRAVLSLRFYEDLTEGRTAEVLGCSVSTVKSQTRHALQRLRDLAPDVVAAYEEVR